MNIGEAQKIFSKNVAWLILKAYELGYEVSLGECWRPSVMALIYTGRYKLYSDSGDEVPLPSKRRGSAKSDHLDRLAIDINLFKDGRYLDKTEDHTALGAYWEGLHPNNYWGGSFDDGNHYGMRTIRR